MLRFQQSIRQFSNSDSTSHRWRPAHSWRPAHNSHNFAPRPRPHVGLAPPTHGRGFLLPRLVFGHLGLTLRSVQCIIELAGPALPGMWAGVAGLRGSCAGLQALRGGYRAALLPGSSLALHTSVTSCGSKNLLKKFASKTRYAPIRVLCRPGRLVHGWIEVVSTVNRCL